MRVFQVAIRIYFILYVIKHCNYVLLYLVAVTSLKASTENVVPISVSQVN